MPLREAGYRLKYYKTPIPPVALREAITNAIVHNDYSSSIPIQISVYEDRLYIWNPGCLPANWTVNTLLGKHPSKPFNPSIANTFFKLGFIEAWGRGFEKINEECIKAGNPLPILNSDLGGLMIEFKAITSQEETQAEKVLKTPNLIIDIMLKEPSITTRDIAKRLGKAPSTIDRAVSKLIENGLLKHVGPKKGGSWVIKSS